MSSPFSSTLWQFSRSTLKCECLRYFSYQQKKNYKFSLAPLRKHFDSRNNWELFACNSRLDAETLSSRFIIKKYLSLPSLVACSLNQRRAYRLGVVFGEVAVALDVHLIWLAANAFTDAFLVAWLLVTLQIDVIFLEERRVFATQPVIAVVALISIFAFPVEIREELALDYRESSVADVAFKVDQRRLRNNKVSDVEIHLNSEFIPKMLAQLKREQKRQPPQKRCAGRTIQHLACFQCGHRTKWR